MSLKAVTNAGEYTDQILTENFTNIAKALKSVDNRFDMFDNWVKHLEGHVSELYEVAKTAATVEVPKTSRVKPFVVGAVVGVVAYRYVKANKRKIEKIQQQAKDQFDNFVSEQRQAQAQESPAGRI